MLALTESKLVRGTKSAKRGELRRLIYNYFFFCIGNQNRKIVLLKDQNCNYVLLKLNQQNNFVIKG